MKAVKKAAFRPGTRNNLKTQLRSYALFCGYYKFNPFPCESEVISDYICFLSHSLLSLASIKNYISGLKTISRLLGHDVSSFDNFDVSLTMQGISKINTHLSKSRLPLTISHIRQMVSLLDTAIPIEACMWVFLTFAFFGMLRASNLLCSSVKSFKKYEQLTRSQVHFCKEGLELHISWSKTRQNHDYLHIVPLARNGDLFLCPFKAYVHLLEVISGAIDSPVMALPKSERELTPLSKSKFLPLFNRLLVQIGLSPSQYSFHSLRHGGATLAAQSGVSELMLKAHGDWRSSCYQTYIKNAHIRSFAVSKQMYSLFSPN